MAISFPCDLNGPTTPLRHPWRHCVGSCHAPTALRADWQQQLSRARYELGFRHVRFHGILSDDMGTLICQDDQFVFSFFNTDRIFDFLLSIGMRPIVELSFMPGTLSSDGNSVFRYRANVTPPKNMADWNLLIGKLVCHWCERYGIDEVSQWPFEVWNEPNLEVFWTGGQAGYFELYRNTWQTIKSVSPRLQVGGPATAQNAWLDAFNAYGNSHACPADFISTHYYPTDAFGQIGADTVTQLEHAPLSVMRDRATQAREAAGQRPLYYTEWNITSNPRDPMHDGAFCAALALRILMSVDDLVDAYSYWVFSDIFEENYLPSVPFHGGFGLINLYGVPKPVYRGLELLLQLGTRQWSVAQRTENVSTWVGASDDDKVTSALFVNVAMPRHTIGTELVQLQLSHSGDRHPRAAFVSRIDEQHANPVAAWHAMGDPEYLSSAQVDALHVASAVVPQAIPFVASDGRTTVDLSLPPDAVCLLRIEWEARPR